MAELQAEQKQRDIHRLEAEIAKLEKQVDELKQANAKAFELVDAEKELRMKAEALAEAEPVSISTKPSRIMGTDIRTRASEAKRKAWEEKGRPKAN
jgi:chromosome segregation ATPase